jgi:hypothetical protein
MPIYGKNPPERWFIATPVHIFTFFRVVPRRFVIKRSQSIFGFYNPGWQAAPVSPLLVTGAGILF